MLKKLREKIDVLLAAGEDDYVDEDSLYACDVALSEAISSKSLRDGLMLKNLKEKIDVLLANGEDLCPSHSLAACDEALSEAVKALREDQAFKLSDWGFLMLLCDRCNVRDPGYWETFCAWDAPECFSVAELTEFVDPQDDPDDAESHRRKDLVDKLWHAVRDRNVETGDSLLDQLVARRPEED